MKWKLIHANEEQPRLVTAGPTPLQQHSNQVHVEISKHSFEGTEDPGRYITAMFLLCSFGVPVNSRYVSACNRGNELPSFAGACLPLRAHPHEGSCLKCTMLRSWRKARLKHNANNAT